MVCRISPLGQRFIQKWGSLRTSAAGAAILLMWAELPAKMQVADKVSPHNARRAAVKQLHYILGDNDRGSYVAGFGANPPKRNHHRDAAIAPWEQNASPDAANKCVCCHASIHVSSHMSACQRHFGSRVCQHPSEATHKHLKVLMVTPTTLPTIPQSNHRHQRHIPDRQARHSRDLWDLLTRIQERAVYKFSQILRNHCCQQHPAFQIGMQIFGSHQPLQFVSALVMNAAAAAGEACSLRCSLEVCEGVAGLRRVRLWAAFAVLQCSPYFVWIYKFS